MKPGPKPGQARTMVRGIMPQEWSERTFAAYWRAWTIFADLNIAGLITDEERAQANLDSTRPNGSFNVCKFARIADSYIMKRALGQED